MPEAPERAGAAKQAPLEGIERFIGETPSFILELRHSNWPEQIYHFQPSSLVQLQKATQIAGESLVPRSIWVELRKETRLYLIHSRLPAGNQLEKVRRSACTGK